MKLYFVTSLVAVLFVGTAVADHEAVFFRGGEERLLGEGDLKDFEDLTMYYNPKGPKCYLEYKVKGESDEERVDFSKSQIRVEHSNGKVTCTKTVPPPDGLKLPIHVDPFLHHATWVSEAVRDADLNWSKGNKKLEVAIKRFRNWGAKYDNGICTLNYMYGSKLTVVDFKKSEVKVDGDKVTCKTTDIDKKVLPLRQGLKKLRKDIPNHRVEWVGSKVKDADVTWEKGDPLKLVIEREVERETGREAFKKLRLKYNDHKQKVVFKYQLEGEHRERQLVFSDVFEARNGTVFFSAGCTEAPDGLTLPVRFDFKPSEVTWRTSCPCDDRDGGKLVQVDSASFRWKDDCSDNGDGRRRLERSGRPSGDIRPKGS